MQEDALKLQVQRLPDLVLRQLMEWVLDGEIRMGQKLNIEELSTRLGVSRMPVREAINSMEKMGIVESVPYVGARIVTLSKADILQLYLVRENLEPTMVFHACRQITREQLERTKSIQIELEDYLKSGETAARQVYRLNREFHFSIYKASNLDKVCDIISMVWDNLSLCKMIYEVSYIKDKREAGRMVSEHREYISLLEEGNSDKLRELLTENLKKRTIEVPEKVSEYLSE